MSGFLTNLCLKQAVRPRVIHRLPGRLRIHVPALLRLKEQRHEWLEAWQTALAFPKWVRSVDVSFVTGNTLVAYDPVAATEAEVLDLIRSVGEVILRNWDRLATCEADAIPELVAALKGDLRETVGGGQPAKGRGHRPVERN